VSFISGSDFHSSFINRVAIREVVLGGWEVGDQYLVPVDDLTGIEVAQVVARRLLIFEEVQKLLVLGSLHLLVGMLVGVVGADFDEGLIVGE
jgi:hypothetical protein